MVQFLTGEAYFYLLQIFRNGFWAHPLLILWSQRDFPPPDDGGDKAKYTHQCNDDIWNGWSYTATPPICLDGVHRNESEHLPSLLLSEWSD